MRKFLLLSILIVGFTSTCLAANSTSTCKAGWKIYKNSCFMAVPLKQNWTTAQAICKTPAFGGRLAELETVDKKTFLEGYMAATYEKAFSHDMFWVGGTDTGNEGHWRWGTTNSSLSYQSWWDHATPMNNTLANCLALGAPTKNKFQDMSCAAQNNFVCEASASVAGVAAQAGGTLVG